MAGIDSRDRPGRVAVIVSVLLAGIGCSRSHSSGPAQGAPEQPWAHAWSGDPDGWWTRWKLQKAEFPEGTRFEMETIEMDGSRATSAWVVRSVSAAAGETVSMDLASDDGSVRRVVAPPPVPYAKQGLLSRNEKLVSVTTPAGTFLAGRIWRSERRGDIVYETDEWL